MDEGDSATRGIDAARVTAWFRENVPGAEPPLSFSLIAGGHSNLTYRVTDAKGGELVLRRPPLGHVLATAHDMGREHKIVKALGPTAVPVPPALGFCSETEVIGAPFYVMTYVPGLVLHDIESATRSLTENERRSTGESFVDVLADLHAVDPDAVGLGDLGKKESYVARQLKRWYGQFQQSKTREIPLVDQMHDLLAANIPEQGRASVVHGDYRLGNCITQKPGKIAAVLDWEICTLGDPLADLGYVLATWTRTTDAAGGAAGAPSMAKGFPSVDEVVKRYGERSGRDLSKMDYYLAFSCWKSACIIEGVYSRYLGGALGETKLDLSSFVRAVDSFSREAAEAWKRYK